MTNLKSSNSFGNSKFRWEQQEQINKGKELNLNVSIYDKPFYKATQMEQIRLGLQDNLAVSIYANPTINSTQMEFIRLLLKGTSHSFECDMFDFS